MVRHCQASHGHQAIRGWPGSATGPEHHGTQQDIFSSTFEDVPERTNPGTSEYSGGSGGGGGGERRTASGKLPSSPPPSSSSSVTERTEIGSRRHARDGGRDVRDGVAASTVGRGRWTMGDGVASGNGRRRTTVRIPCEGEAVLGTRDYKAQHVSCARDGDKMPRRRQSVSFNSRGTGTETRLLRTGQTKENKQAICYRCCARQDSRAHTAVP